MPRATNAPASRERRKRMVTAAAGYRGRRSKLFRYRGRRSKLFRYAKDARMKAMYWSYRDRKAKKRNFRNLWIGRMSAALRSQGISYSAFAGSLRKAGVQLDRKVLADLAANEPSAFSAVVQAVRG